MKEGLLTDALTLLNLGAIDRRRVLEEDKRMVKERLLQKHQPCPKTRSAITLDVFVSLDCCYIFLLADRSEEHTSELQSR